MRIPDHPTLIRRMIDARLKRLGPRCAPLAASLVRQSGSRGGWQLTFKDEGKTQTVYVPKSLTQEVRASIREHRRIRALLQEITQLRLAAVRAHVQAGRRRGARL